MKFENIAKECRTTHKGNIAGVPIVGLEHIEPGDMLLKHWDVDVETTFTKSFQKGQILFGRRRAYQHKACVATCNGICSGDITVIEPIKGAVYPDLLPFIIQNDAFFDHAIKGSNGALSPRVKWEHMANYEFSLPPIEEQKVLADKLWAAYEVKQSYLNMIDATNQMVKAKFVEMFGGEKLIHLEEKVKTQSGGTPNTKKSEYYNGGDIPWLSSGEINQGYISTTVNFITQEGLNNSSAKWVPQNSVVIAMYGATAGKVGFLNIRATTNQAVCALIPNDEFEPKFLYYAVADRSSWMIAQCRGAAQPNISQGIIRSMQIPCPPIVRQKEFVSIVEQAETSIAHLNDSIAAIDRVIRSLINENL